MVVDDDAELRDLLVRSLTRDGHVVRSCACVTSARQAIAEEHPDLVVLDLSLPDGDGLELCRELRAVADPVAVLVLTANSEVAVRVGSLDAGADDFLAKPFAVAELRARVRALGRRRLVGARPMVISRGELSLDFAARRAQLGPKPVELTAREWAILTSLAARPGRLVSRTELLYEGWGEASAQAASSLEVLVGRIRRKLGTQLIRTLRGEGYAFESG